MIGGRTTRLNRVGGCIEVERTARLGDVAALIREDNLHPWAAASTSSTHLRGGLIRGMVTPLTVPRGHSAATLRAKRRIQPQCLPHRSMRRQAWREQAHLSQIGGCRVGGCRPADRLGPGDQVDAAAMLGHAEVGGVQDRPLDRGEARLQIGEDAACEVASGALLGSASPVALGPVVGEAGHVLREQPTRPERIDGGDRPRPSVPLILRAEPLPCDRPALAREARPQNIDADEGTPVHSPHIALDHFPVELPGGDGRAKRPAGVRIPFHKGAVLQSGGVQAERRAPGAGEALDASEAHLPLLSRRSSGRQRQPGLVTLVTVSVSTIHPLAVTAATSAARAAASVGHQP
jgi:hypothetical protein